MWAAANDTNEKGNALTSTDVATVEEADQAALAVSDETAALIAGAQAEEFDEDSYSTPILKVGQGLTKEVTEGDAEPGEFINTLTSEGLGDAVEFIISYYNKGRFAASKELDKAFVAFSPDIPENWAPFVKPEFIGTPFSEYPDAEEQFKAACNNNEREWGHGPPVSTTHNYTGYVLVESDEGTDYQPARLSLKRTDVPAHRKISTLLRAIVGGSRNKPSWDVVLRLATKKKEFGSHSAWVINPNDVKILRKTTPAEKQLGSELALAVMNGRTQAVGAEDALEDRPSEPAQGDGLQV